MIFEGDSFVCEMGKTKTFHLRFSKSQKIQSLGSNRGFEFYDVVGIMEGMAIEPRCAVCGWMKLHHTISLTCPDLIWVLDRYDETKMRVKCVGYLETKYEPQK